MILMIGNKKHKILVVVLLTITLASGGVANSAFATNTEIKINCKDLALALITWDQLVATATEDDIAENEHGLNDEGIEPDLYNNIIDDHLKELIEHVQDECLNYDSNIEDMLDDIDFELPS